MAEKDYREMVSALCLIVLAATMLFIFGWALGRASVEPIETKVEVEQSYRTGDVPYNTPIWAVYEERGMLTAYSAIRVDNGTIFPFSISEMPVPYDPMPHPDAWTTLTAGILEVLK